LYDDAFVLRIHISSPPGDHHLRQFSIASVLHYCPVITQGVIVPAIGAGAVFYFLCRQRDNKKTTKQNQ
jgi:hypothetical protein